MNSLIPTDPELDKIGIAVQGRVSRRQRNLRRASILGIAGVSVAVVTGGSAWIMLANQTMRETAAYCYAEDSTTSAFVTVAANGSADAVSLCEAVWRAGAIGEGREPSDGTSFPVPDLVACLRSDGVRSVFPVGTGESTLCATLGLSD